MVMEQTRLVTDRRTDERTTRAK